MSFNTRSKIVSQNADAILSLYRQGKSIELLAKQYSVSKTPINRLIRYSGIPIRDGSLIRKHLVNENYFKIIDSHEKAQIFGFICADGCIYSPKTKSSLYLSIAIHEKDKDYLQTIADKLGYTGPIRTQNKKCGSRHVLLSICNKILCQDLINLGCHPRKSGVLLFPTNKQVPDEFIGSYILGYMEGNGSIFKKGNCYFTSLMGPNKFTETLSNLIRKKLGVIGILEDNRKSPLVRQMRIEAREHAFAFLKFIYKNAAFTMKRKYDRFLQCKKQEEHDPNDKDFWKNLSGRYSCRVFKPLLSIVE